MSLLQESTERTTWSRFPLPNGPEYRDGIDVSFEGAQVLSASDLLSKGFATVPDWLMSREDVPPGAKLVYAQIITYLNMGRSFPGQPELAKKVGLKERQVRNHLCLLKNMGLLKVERPNRLLGNIYRGLDNQWVRDFRASSGTGLPVRAAPDCRSERQAGASPSEEEKKPEKNISSYGGDGTMELRPIASACAGSGSLRGGEPQSQNSAASAPCVKEQQSMENTDDRRKRLGMVLAQTAQRTRNEMVLKGTKQAAKRQKALSEDKYFRSIVALEVVWHLTTGRRFSNWRNSERGIVGDLLKRFDFTVAEEEIAAAFRFAVKHEAALIAHLVGPKKQVSLSLSFLHRNAETWLMLSKQWRKHQDTWDKVDAWRAKNPGEYATMPYDLEQAYDEARSTFGLATGFKI